MKRLIEQESCEHGKFEAHQTYIKDRRGNIGAEGPVCPGGSSREITVDYEAAAVSLYEEPEEGRTWEGADEDTKLAYRVMAEDAVDAALGGGR